MIRQILIHYLPRVILAIFLFVASAKVDLRAEVSPDEVVMRQIYLRKISLSVENMPLKEVLAKFAAMAEVELKLSDEMLALIDLERLQNVSIKDFELASALTVVLANQRSNRLGTSYPVVGIHNKSVVVTTLRAERDRIRRQLPAWLQSVYDDHKISVTVDSKQQVAEIQVDDELTDELLSHFPSLAGLRRLKISGKTPFTEEGLTHLAKLQALEELDLSINPTGSLSDEILKNICALPNLRTLRLHESGVTDEGLRYLERHPHLTNLQIYQEGRLTEAAVISVAKQRQLKSLALIYYVGTELGHMRFSNSTTNLLESLSNLEYLDLSGQEFSPELLRFPHLKSLVLSGTEFDAVMGVILRESRHLSKLRLNYRQITDDAFELLSGHPALSDLNIRSQGISDVTMSHLFRLPKLARVELWTSGLSDNSLASLAKIESLAELELNWGTNRFTAAGLKSLSQAPELQTLDLLIIPQTGAFGGGLNLPASPPSGPIRTELPGPQFNGRLPVDMSELSKALPKTRIEIRHDHFNIGPK
ncbi:MAG: hypothetical protein WCJ09_05155 [Planctomycetota bacterium]